MHFEKGDTGVRYEYYQYWLQRDRTSVSRIISRDLILLTALSQLCERGLARSRSKVQSVAITTFLGNLAFNVNIISMEGLVPGKSRELNPKFRTIYGIEFC